MQIICNKTGNSMVGSHTEDNINVHNSSGTSGDWIQVANNITNGGSSITGSGIMVGDMVGTNNADATVLDPSLLLNTAFPACN